MLIKEIFSLVKGVPNYFQMSERELDNLRIERGVEKLAYSLSMSKSNIRHYTKEKIFNILEKDKTKQNRVSVIYLPEYIFPVSYNKPTDTILINLAPFGVKEITMKPSYINLYACMIYGVCLAEIISNRQVVNYRYSKSFVEFFLSVLLRTFGKKYGLLGTFIHKISMLKFLIGCYILSSFMGIDKKGLYRKVIQIVPFEYRSIEEKLDTYNFVSIDEFLRCLSEMQVFPNINKHLFVSELIKKFHQVDFLLVLEDIARFVSIIAASEVKGTEIVPTFLEKYNGEAFGSILEISKSIFKR